MIDNQQIKKAANRHIMNILRIIAPICLIVIFCGQSIFGDNNPSVIHATCLASVVAFLECFIVAKLWSWMARCHKESFATFYMVSPACRIFAVLISLIIVFFIVGREEIITFIVAFVVMYFILLVYHSWFFTRMSKKLFDDTKVTNKE